MLSAAWWPFCSACSVLRGRTTSYHDILQSLEAMRYGFGFFFLGAMKLDWQLGKVLLSVCEISERYGDFSMQYRDFD